MSQALPKPARHLSSGQLLGLVAACGVCLAMAIGGFVLYTAKFGIATFNTAVGGPFTLVDDHGHRVTDRSWPGKYLLIYFGYTSCPDACPLTLSRLTDALRQVGPEAERLQFLFITVDPRRDKPATLANYTALFSSHLTGLTGTDAEIARVTKEYGVTYNAQQTAQGSSSYLVDHSHSIYLMAPDGRFVSNIYEYPDIKFMARQIEDNL